MIPAACEKNVFHLFRPSAGGKPHIFEYYGKNKGKNYGEVPHGNFYFVALLVFLDCLTILSAT